MKTFLLLLLLVTIVGCGSLELANSENVPETDSEQAVERRRPLAIENGKFFEVGGKKMLYGGKDSTQHFNITNCALKEEQFHYGMGREAFPALLEPEFISVAQADSIWPDSARFLLAYAGNEVKAYSIKDLTRHEVVNDVLGGKPIMAAYCILANLGAIYDRSYDGNVLTFALSGYTYFDKDAWSGLDGFVLWDRETESLWWPLIGEAVSGPLKKVQLVELDKNNWEDVQWKHIKENYSNALVLKSGQNFARPTTWSKTVNTSEIIKNYSLKK